jgi:oxaloacetate decarboxylase alpha subunit
VAGRIAGEECGLEFSRGGAVRERSVRRLIRLFEESTLEEFEFRSWGLRLRLRKPSSPAPPPPVVVAEESATTKEEGVEHREETLAAITSPMVGTFYRAPAPDARPYAEVGDMISKGQIVCIVEAMKLFNEIESECSGRIANVLVEDAHPVEYGQVLFEVDSSVRA